MVHNLCDDFEARQKPSERCRVETWITSLTSTRSAVGLKGWSSVIRPRATGISSASSTAAVTLATVCTNAESQVSKGFLSSGGLEEEDEKSGHSSRDRDILGKRAREMAEVRGQTLVHYIFI